MDCITTTLFVFMEHNEHEPRHDRRDMMDCPMRFMGCFLISAGIYRNQNLVPPQEPGRKRGVVPGPDGFARHFKAPFVNPELQCRLIMEVVFSLQKPE